MSAIIVDARAETEGATMRAELAAGLCQTSWTDLPKQYLYAHSEDVYRGHRCSRTNGHRGDHRCRYCDRERSASS